VVQDTFAGGVSSLRRVTLPGGVMTSGGTARRSFLSIRFVVAAVGAFHRCSLGPRVIR
jgi:hypothetical protein